MQRHFFFGSFRFDAATNLSAVSGALRDFGFRAILAESFADIFVANCTNNRIAAIAVDVDEIAQRTDRLTIDLEKCEIRDDRGFIAPFDIDQFRRERLRHGYDEIALTLRYESKIAEFETAQPPAKWDAFKYTSATERKGLAPTIPHVVRWPKRFCATWPGSIRGIQRWDREDSRSAARDRGDARNRNRHVRAHFEAARSADE